MTHDELDRMYQMEAEAVAQAHALDGAMESANLWTGIAEQRQATIERLEAENAALREALATIGQGLDPYASPFHNWIAGVVDTALAKAQPS
jgi:hypothetical protein